MLISFDRLFSFLRSYSQALSGLDGLLGVQGNEGDPVRKFALLKLILTHFTNFSLISFSPANFKG